MKISLFSILFAPFSHTVVPTFLSDCGEIRFERADSDFFFTFIQLFYEVRK
jgi:hypothetical protein